LSTLETSTRPALAELPLTENRPTSGWRPRLDFRELWSYRDLAAILAGRTLKLRYKQTAIGIGWVVLQPLIAIAIFSVIFGKLADLPSEGLPYPVFAMAGLAFWLYFASAVREGAECLVVDRDLVTKTYFPRILAPVAATLPALLDLSVVLVIAGVMLAAYEVAPPVEIVLLPAWIVAGVVVALATSLWLSALNVLYRDVRYALPFMIQVWLYASPVVFPSSLFDGLDRWLYSLNPVVGVIDGFRWSLLGAPAPPTADLVCAAVTLVLLVTGVLYFQRVQKHFADQI